MARKASNKTDQMASVPPTATVDLMDFFKYQEQVRKEEAEERERVRLEEMEDRQRQRQEADDKERRWKDERDMMQQQFIQLFNKLDDTGREARRDRMDLEAERKEQKKRDAIPKLSIMTREVDIMEYLDTFEDNMKRRAVPKKEWSGHLVPLLNDECRTAAVQMPADEREEYDTLKEELLETCATGLSRTGDSFWNYDRKKGQSSLSLTNVLQRLAIRFASRDTVRDSIDQFVMEKFLQMLPPAAAILVRGQEPKTSKEAAKLANRYFQDRHADPDDFTWGRKNDWRDGKRSYGERSDTHRHEYRYGREERSYREDRRGEKKEKLGMGGHSMEKGTVMEPEKVKKDISMYWDKVKGPQCFECHAWGHVRDQCPSKVLVVQSPQGALAKKPTGTSPELVLDKLRPVVEMLQKRGPTTMPGFINGQRIDNMILDSGAANTVVDGAILPDGCKTGEKAELRGVIDKVTTFDVAFVTLEIGGWKLDLEVLVAPPNSIFRTVLVGRDVPGLEVTMKPPPQTEILPVMTRAAVRREADQQAQDDEATEASGFTPLPFDDIPDLDDLDDATLGVDQERPEETDHRRPEEMDQVDEEYDERGEEDDPPVQWLPTPFDTWEDDILREKQLPEQEHWLSLTRQDLIVRQQHDPTLQPLIGAARETADSPYHLKEGLLMRQAETSFGEKVDLIAVPVDLRLKIFNIAHAAQLAGHLGKKRTAARISRHFYWPGLGKDVGIWCRECLKCQRGNRKKPAKAPLMPLPLIDRPWQRIAIDIVGPLERSTRGHKYLLTIMDYATRYPEAVPLRCTDAPTICEQLLIVFSRFGLPDELLSDRGANFLATITEELLKQLGVRHIKTSPYHPQSNGMLERFHATLKAMVRKTCPSPKEWDRWIPYALFAYRETPHAVTGFSPFELLFGREVRGPVALLSEQWRLPEKMPQSVVHFMLDTQDKLRQSFDLVRKLEQTNKKKVKAWYDTGARDDPIAVGEEVLVLLPEDSTGISAQWHGPYRVVDKPSPLSYKIATPDRGRKTRQFHRNLLKRYVTPSHTLLVVVADDDKSEDDQLHPIYPPVPHMGVYDEITHPHLDQSQQMELQTLLEDFDDIFSESPGRTNGIMHHIRTGTSTPISQLPYRIPVKWKPELEAEVDQLLQQGIITKSDSPWASPVVCVRKKDGSLRMCIDYRKLNAVTDNDIYPLPRIEEMLDTLGEAKYISTIDLAKGYYQIPVAEEDKTKTAFVTPFGKFQFERMPFGLKGAPATFQRAMDSMLSAHRDYSDAYIDDIAIYSVSWEDHLQHLRTVFGELRKEKLTAKLKKCVFGQREVSFLGHTVGAGIVQPQRAKVAAIHNFQCPQQKKDVRAFLGLVGYYRRFIPQFSLIAAPLTDLTKKTAPNRCLWTDEHQAAFDALREALLKDNVLRNPDHSKCFILHTDASHRGVGAVLSQNDDEGQEHPVAFYSRKFLPRETRYTTTEQECLAIVNSVKHFAVYLLGQEFRIVTDHGALKYLHSMKNGGPRLTRWALALQPFCYTVEHRRGVHHTNADGLSRQAWTEEDNSLGFAPEEGGEGVRDLITP